MPAAHQLAADSLKAYRDLMRQLKAAHGPSSVEESSALFQQAKERVAVAIAARRARKAELDPRGAFIRLKGKLAVAQTRYQAAKANIAQLRNEHAEALRSAYEAAKERVAYTRGEGDTDAAAATASTSGRTWDEAARGERLETLTESYPLLRLLVTGGVGVVSRVFMTRLNSTSVEGAEHLEAALSRPPGTPLITVSNHVASLDDPLVVSALVPPTYLGRPHELRWTLCATDRCFKSGLAAAFFRAGKVLPVERGAGLRQPGMSVAEALLAGGGWVHVFPEGTRSRDGRLGACRKGVGRLVAAAAAAGAAPVVVPFVHAGMDAVVPRGAALPRVGQAVRVAVGEPVPMADLLAAAEGEGWDEDRLYRAVAARVGGALAALAARLEGAEARAAVDVISDDALLPLIEDEMDSLSHRWGASWRERFGLPFGAPRPPAALTAGAAAAETAPVELHDNGNFSATMPADAMLAAQSGVLCAASPGEARQASTLRLLRAAATLPAAHASAALVEAAGYARQRSDAVMRMCLA